MALTSPTFDDKITTSPIWLHFHFTFSRTVQWAFHKSPVYATLLFVNQTEEESLQMVQFFQMSPLVYYLGIDLLNDQANRDQNVRGIKLLHLWH